MGKWFDDLIGTLGWLSEKEPILKFRLCLNELGLAELDLLCKDTVS